MYVPRHKNPQFNRIINPNLNRTINPNTNRSINPLTNRTINPLTNRAINPLTNRTINPLANRTINPLTNRTINPLTNRTINPRLNRNVNPNVNFNFDGYFVFDMSLFAVEFIVIANANVIQVYDFNLNNVRFGVHHAQNGYAMFQPDNTYIGHLESDGQMGFNEFNINNTWVRVIK